MFDSLLDRQAFFRIRMQHAFNEIFKILRKWIILLTHSVLGCVFYLTFLVFAQFGPELLCDNHFKGDIIKLFFLLSPELKIVTLLQMLVMIVLIIDKLKGIFYNKHDEKRDTNGKHIYRLSFVGLG